MSIQKLPFLDVFKDASGGNIKTLQREFLEEGEIPVVDQGQKLVAGFVNDRSRICKAKPPVIVFGDHTRAVKYVDFQFAMGADGTKVLVPKIESDTKYLYYALNAVELPEAGYSRHYKFLKETQIHLPQLAEQKRIARILDAADALRAKRREALAQLHTLIQSTFLDMFGNPVTNPMGWELRELSRTKSNVQIGPFGSLLHKEDYIVDGVPVVNPMHIVSGQIHVGREQTVSEQKAATLSNYLLQTGDVVMGRRGEMGRVAIVSEANAGMLCGTGSLFFRPDPDEFSSRFLASTFSSEPMKRLLEGLSQGVTMPNLNRTMIEGLKVVIPPIDLQRAFGAVVESVERQKASQRAHLAELDTLFASLQSRAFRGDL